MSEKPKRPWHSFRASILFWILLPLVIVTIADIVFAFMHALAAGPRN